MSAVSYSFSNILHKLTFFRIAFQQIDAYTLLKHTTAHKGVDCEYGCIYCLRSSKCLIHQEKQPVSYSREVTGGVKLFIRIFFSISREVFVYMAYL